MMAIVDAKLFAPILISFSVVIATIFNLRTMTIKLLRNFSQNTTTMESNNFQHNIPSRMGGIKAK